MDHMGQDEEAPGTDAIKYPMGILDYALSNHTQADVSWKITGNLGGEAYRDKTRGPHNEGGMFVERMEYHLPYPPVNDRSIGWEDRSPIHDGTSNAGVMFFTTSFALDLPEGYDVPLGFAFANNTINYDDEGMVRHYRVQLCVNGWHFGKYVSHLGPQEVYPVPEGILDHRGLNWLGMTIWSLDEDGARLGGLELVSSMPVMSGMRRRWVVEGERWGLRQGGY